MNDMFKKDMVKKYNSYSVNKTYLKKTNKNKKLGLLNWHIKIKFVEVFKTLQYIVLKQYFGNREDRFKGLKRL